MTTESTEKTEQVSTSSGSPLALLLSVIAIGLVLALGYFGYFQHQSMTAKLQELEQSKGVYQNQIRDMQQVLEAQSVQNAELLALIEERDSGVDEAIGGLTNQLSDALNNINNMTGKQDNSWRAQQAYQLLKIANNRIMFMQDVDTAIYLLNQADELLAELDDPNLFLTRQKVNEDRQRLNSWPKIDATGLAIRVAALQSSVAQLPVVIVVEQQQVEAEQVAPETWYEHLLYSFQQLGDQWFTVRQHGAGYTPILSEADEQKLRFAIMMTLQTVQYAILHHNDDLYQASLLQLKSRLENYFDISDSAVQTIVLEIAELLEIKVGYDSSEGITGLLPLSTYLNERSNSVNRAKQATETSETDQKEAEQKEAVTPEPEPAEDEAKEQQPDGEEPPVG